MADIADVGRYRPFMVERVFQRSEPVAPEFVLERHRDFCAGSNGLRNDGADIFDLQVDGDRRALERLRSESAPLGNSSISISMELPMRIDALTSFP